MDLQTSLITSKTRESSGSETIKRYDFQKDFSLILMIDMYLSWKDFVILFEFHDDILVIDSAINPGNLNFYQVKTKATGNWTTNALLKAKEWEKSILWKMYLNKELFPKNTKNIFLVSNARFSLKLKNGNKWEDKADISWTELADTEINKINDDLMKELLLVSKPQFELIWNFHVTDLSLKDSQQHCIWKLSCLIDEISSESAVNSSVAYRAIYDHIKKKSSAIFTEIEKTELKGDEFEKLIKLKWITKNEFQWILETIGVWKDPEKIWLRIETDLKSTWLNIVTLKPYKRWWDMYRSALIADSENTHFFKEVKFYVLNRSKDKGFWDGLNIIQLCDILYNEISIKYTDLMDVYEEYFIKGLILNELYDS